MRFDLIAIVLVTLFALWGAWSGFSRQAAQAGAVAVALFSSPWLAKWVAPHAATRMEVSTRIALMVCTVTFFVLIFLLSRALLGFIFQRLLSADENKSPMDRTMGFVAGGLKAAVAIWVATSLMTYAESQISVGGKRLAVVTADSKIASLCKEYNFLSLVQTPRVREFMAAAKMAGGETKGNGPLQGLLKDETFQELLKNDVLKKAVQQGDVQTLWKDGRVLEFLSKQKNQEQLEQIARFAEGN